MNERDKRLHDWLIKLELALKAKHPERSDQADAFEIRLAALQGMRDSRAESPKDGACWVTMQGAGYELALELEAILYDRETPASTE